MEIVAEDASVEALVRVLVQAMESPHGARPGRPQKIVVRSRETQFFLRGVLQELDIKVDCEGELPLIDEIFQSFAEAATSRSPSLPESFREDLLQKARLLWEDAPWEWLADYQIISIEVNHWEVETLFASVMGMLGMEHGVLFYRSLDSLRQFREAAEQKRGGHDLEDAFLKQDCFFLTYTAESDDEEEDIGSLPSELIEPNFGTIHPLEGLRPTLYEDEAMVMLVAIEALRRFFRQHRRHLKDTFSAQNSRYRIPNPQPGEAAISIQVSTLPDLATELLADEDEDSEFGSDTQVILREDLIPEKSQLALGMLPWHVVEHLKLSNQFYPFPSGEMKEVGEGLPVIIVQTSRPKALTLIKTLQQAGGPKGICFNTGVDPFDGTRYELEILQTQDGELHLFGEFYENDPTHIEARKKWDRRCRKTGGFCGLVVAMGVTTGRREGLQLRHMMALFVLESQAPTGMGLGPMVRVSRFS
jgi:hypothetical protein